MVNGNSMLPSSSSAFLLSTAHTPPNAAAGNTAPSAGVPALPGFAELLRTLPGRGKAEVSGGLSGAEVVSKTAADALSSGFVAKTTKCADARSQAGQAAKVDKAATSGGKNLPVRLPEVAATVAKTAAGSGETSDEGIDEKTAGAAVIAPVDPLLALFGNPVVPAPSVSPSGGQSSANPTTAAAPAVPHSLAHTTAEPQTADRPTAAARAAVIPITVSTPRELTTTAAAEIAAETTSASQPKPTQAVERSRGEAPLPPQQAVSAPVAAAQPDRAAPVPVIPASSAPAAMPSAADINAALDRLVAAREALMPAQAAVAIDHADFGEISIRFEQSSDGRLSAELHAADPELQRAVSAAAGAERSQSSGAESDGGRSMNLANHRGSAGGGEAAARDGGQSRSERELHRQPASGRTQAEPGEADQRPGVFA